MSSDTTRTRRGVLGTIGAVLAGAGIVGTTGAAAESTSEDRQAEPFSRQSTDTDSPPTQQQHTPNRQYEWYSGTVDRIVGGEHVVILLESDGRVVDQVVVDRSELQHVEEGDQVLVLRSGDDVVTIVRIG